MADKAQASDDAPATEETPTPAPKRSPGHRGTDVRDAVAEMTARAHEISLEAGSKMAAAMKDVINAAAGLAGFAIESARDLVQYMVRRGQMTQDEADKLLREAEEAHARRKPPAESAAARTEPRARAAEPAARVAPRIAPRAEAPEPAPAKPAAARAPEKAAKPAAKAPAKGATKAAAKAPEKAAKPAAKGAAKSAAKKPAAKAAGKAPAKKPAAKKR
jgi:hypothetical protein